MTEKELWNYMNDIMEQINNSNIPNEDEDSFIIPDPPDGSGVLTEYWDKSNPEYCIPKLMAYTRARGKKAPIELTEEEREMFRTN